MNNIDNQKKIPLSEADKTILLSKLKEAKNDYKILLVIFFIVWLVSPYLSHFGEDDALINSMSYGFSLLYMSAFFIAYLVFNYFKYLNKINQACKTDFKIIVLTQVAKKKKSPAFHRKEYCLYVTDAYIQKLYFAKELFDEYQVGDLLQLEISGKGKQVINIKKR
ncbi:hypothetical protein GALL_108580 [mine drainage metagenome]|uniref:Uncharacterized protein n=1 Tax=mine drainage metagenome TaxID=410659 RepID=A0A1J5SSF6_9ZZZZ